MFGFEGLECIEGLKGLTQPSCNSLKNYLITVRTLFKVFNKISGFEAFELGIPPLLKSYIDGSDGLEGMKGVKGLRAPFILLKLLEGLKG